MNYLLLLDAVATISKLYKQSSKITSSFIIDKLQTIIRNTYASPKDYFIAIKNILDLNMNTSFETIKSRYKI